VRNVGLVGGFEAPSQLRSANQEIFESRHPRGSRKDIPSLAMTNKPFRSDVLTGTERPISGHAKRQPPT